MGILSKHLALGFSALLPIVNPLGSALVFLGLVGVQPPKVYKSLAWQITLNMILFFAVIELVGAYLLSFFGISLSIVQLAGGIVVAAIGWSLLNEGESGMKRDAGDAARKGGDEVESDWASKTFYPLMFPVTAGPGSLVVMLTLSAHASGRSLTEDVLARVGLMLSVLLVAVVVYLCYAYAPQITQKISPSTVQGIVRVIAFILLCIGVQIAWNGLQSLLTPLLRRV